MTRFAYTYDQQAEQVPSTPSNADTTATVIEPAPVRQPPDAPRPAREVSVLLWILAVLLIFWIAVMVLSVVRWSLRRRASNERTPMVRLSDRESAWKTAGRRAAPIASDEPPQPPRTRQQTPPDAPTS